MGIIERQKALNETTRTLAHHFESHRNRITDLILVAAKTATVSNNDSKPALAILGAGNGNDLDLAALLDSYSSIHLFDFDGDALNYQRNKLSDSILASKKIVFEPAIDLSGIADDLENMSPNPTESSVLALAEKARRVELILSDRQFDVVASTCMLTQLLDSAVKAYGDESPHKNYMMIALRDGHLRLMSKMLGMGAVGILVTDFVSSDTLPEIAQTENDDTVLELSRRAINDRNFFTGTNPWAIKDSLAKMLVETSSQPWSIESSWRWQIGDSRFYLVTAIKFSKQF